MSRARPRWLPSSPTTSRHPWTRLALAAGRLWPGCRAVGRGDAARGGSRPVMILERTPPVPVVCGGGQQRPGRGGSFARSLAEVGGRLRTGSPSISGSGRRDGLDSGDCLGRAVANLVAMPSVCNRLYSAPGLPWQEDGSRLPDRGTGGPGMPKTSVSQARLMPFPSGLDVARWRPLVTVGLVRGDRPNGGPRDGRRAEGSASCRCLGGGAGLLRQPHPHSISLPAGSKRQGGQC